MNCNFGFKLEKKTDGTYTCVKDVWDRTCPANEWRNNDGICERKTDHKKYCEGQHKESAVSASCTKTFSDRSEDVYFSKSAPCRFQFTPGHDNRCTYKQKGMGLVEVKYKKNADAFAEKAKYDLDIQRKTDLLNELKHIRFDSSQYPFRAYDNYTFTTSDLEQKDTITIADRTQIFRKDYPGVWTPGKCADGELKTFDECMPTWESGTCKNKDGNIIARGGSTPYAEQRAKSFCNQSRHTWITGRCQQDLETNARACWVTETDCERETHTWTPASCSNQNLHTESECLSRNTWNPAYCSDGSGRSQKNCKPNTWTPAHCSDDSGRDENECKSRGKWVEYTSKYRDFTGWCLKQSGEPDWESF